MSKGLAYVGLFLLALAAILLAASGVMVPTAAAGITQSLKPALAASELSAAERFGATFLEISSIEGIDLTYYKGHSIPDHYPQSEVGQKRLKDLAWRVKQTLRDPNLPQKAGPPLFCALVVYKNVQYVRVLFVSEGDPTGTLGWFDPATSKWLGVFAGKDSLGFMQGWPRGATEYYPTDSISDCLQWLGGKMPDPSSY